MTHRLPDLPRPERLRVSAQVLLAGVLLLTYLCGSYQSQLDPASWRGWLFLHGGRLSCAATLGLIPGLVCFGLAAGLRSGRALGWVTAALWTCVLFAVYVDTRLYALFRYHFNGLVWNVLTTAGAEETVHLSTREVVVTVALFAALVPLLALLHRWLWRSAAEGKRSRLLSLLAAPSRVWKLFLLPNMLAVAAVYAWSDLERDPSVMAYARVYPLYPRLTIKRFAQRYLGVTLRERPEVDLPAAGLMLAYPEELPRLPDGPRPNVLVIAIDSLRADQLDSETMPNTMRLAERGRLFRDHFSTGNATRFGLFGLLYGLHGSYWKPVYHEHRSPVLVDALLAAGYDFRVLTSASMDFPEFRSTAWVRVESCVEDRLPSARPGGRDDGVVRRFEEWLGARADSAPFFAFLLLDAPHQAYSFPEEAARFHPYLDEITYSAIDAGASPELRTRLFNRYRNAVHYADQCTGAILAALEASGESRETVIVVTGDHGEEFLESGVFGHTSNFTRAQIQVPLVLAGPGVPPGEETLPTSHLDVAATLLELLGADPRTRARWTLGGNLLSPDPGRARVSSGWDTLGVHVRDRILEIPMAGYGGTRIGVYAQDWSPAADAEDFLTREGRVLAELARECRRFLR